MKKVLYILMISILTLSLFGCKKQVNNLGETKESKVDPLEQDHSNDPLSTSEVNIDTESFEDSENGVLYNQAGCEYIILPDRYIEKYPQLQESILAFNQKTKEYAENFIEVNKPEIREMRKDRNDDTLELYYQSTINVERIDDIVFSFSFNEDSYLGGAHGSYYTIYHNFDPKTGLEITSDDVFTNKNKLKDALIKTIKEAYATEDTFLFDDWQTTLDNHFKEKKPLNFLIGKNFVDVLFDVYYLGPYSTGPIDCLFLYEDGKDFINKKFFK